MATRSAVPVILAVAVCFPAWAVVPALGRTTSPEPPLQAVGAVTVAAPAPSAEWNRAATVRERKELLAQAQPEEDEGEAEEEAEEPEEGEGAFEAFPEEKPEQAPTPTPPIGAKEGPPALPTAPEAPPVPGPAPGVPAPAPAVTPGRPQFVSLNFENADLELVLRSIADITGINFILAPGVKAPVTMRTTTKVPASEVFSIMEAILAVNNLVAVKDGPVYKIVPVAVAQQEPQAIQIGKEAAPEREREQYITQIVRLDHLSAEEMAKLLQGFLGRGAKLVVHKETNSLVIGGFTSTVKRLLDTIRALDTPTKRDNVQRIFVYFVENVKAAELANILNTLYGRVGALPRPPAPGARPTPPGRPGAPLPPAPLPGQPPGLPGQPPTAAPLPLGAEAAPGEVVGEVTIVSDEATNALIIKTSPRNYEFIEATIKKLDIVPKQVLIELLIAQITLDDTFKLGIEEFFRSGDFVIQNTQGASPLPPVRGNLLSGVSGLTLTFVEGRAFQVFLNSVSTKNKVQVLASPHLLTADNKEAKIQIGQEVPIPTGTERPVAGATTTVFSTFQRKDIGIIMGIKPHVNEKRLVTLDIETENTAVSSLGTPESGGPSFTKTTTKTAIVVQDGQSILMGGIIRQDKSKGYSGIPFLSEIPLLGYLFRTTTDTLTRNELLILITPRVIASPEEGRALTEQFRERVESLEPILKDMPQLPPPKQ